MIGRGMFILTALTSCVLSLPVTSSHLENEDVKVMKCIVEALTDVLSRPHSLPISQDCLVTLKTDDRLVTILRHHNFLKELQHIAVQGGQERAQLQGDTVVSDHVTHIPQTTDPVPDQSMLDALGGPGERSILDQKRKTGNEDGGEEEEERMNYEESQEHSERGGTEEEKREKGSMTNWRDGKAEKREEEEDEEKQTNSEETTEEGYEEENMTKEKKGDESDEERDAPQAKSEETKFPKENKEESGEGQDKKRSPFFSHDDTQGEKEEEEEEEEDEGEMKRGSRDSLKRWSKRAKSLSAKKRAGEKEVPQLGGEQEVPHHSKEVVAGEEDKSRGETQRSPEEKELQMIARRTPEERRVMEEEGSASRKPEEPEIESLAAIESELESVAQKLHELRRG